MDTLLAGTAASRFDGAPVVTQLWQDIVSGAAAPRVRRQAELNTQLRQRLAATELRTYHNNQVWA